MASSDSMTLADAEAVTAADVYATARFNMVESQIRTNKVTDPALLAALSRLPRQIFVPAELAGVAYVDKGLRIAPNRYLVEPLTTARLLQAAEVTPADRVLVIGAGTGYSAAILGDLAASVTAVESDAALADAARSNLAALAVTNAVVHTGPLEKGHAASGPYDVVLIDGMIADLPKKIADQMVEHGRLVTVKAQEGRSGTGMLYRKLGGSVSGRVLFDAVTPFLPGFEPRSAFAL
jgi:protein-L-isoaspartate(D-aspartate) O-methyltransferase